MGTVLKKIQYFIRYLQFHTLHRRSRKDIERWQGERLSRLIRHARRNVPLFRELYAMLPVDLHFPDDTRRLPVTSKRNYLGKTVDSYTNNSASLLGRWSHTSGTSGEPFTVLKRIQLSMILYTDSIHYRTLLWEKPWRLDATWARIATIKVRAPERKNRLFISVAEFLENEEGALRKIAEFRPYVIEGYAAVLYALAKRARALDRRLTCRYVISGGENMTPGMRAYIQETFHAEVISRYGMEEVGVLATECSAHDGLHTNCESIFVEIVDQDGDPVPEGQEGRIIVTDLYNFSMPFIRYDTGDHGRISWEKCSCGVSAPRIWLEGRHAAFLDFPHRRIHQLEFDAGLDMFMNVIAQYQVVKNSDSRITVRIVPGQGFERAHEGEVIEHMQKIVGPSVEVLVSLVTEIPFTERGKSRIVSDESKSR